MPRIEEMYAFVAEDTGPDDEGIVDMSVGSVMLPLVGADMSQADSLRSMARNVSVQTGKKVRLIRFTQREDLGEV